MMYRRVLPALALLALLICARACAESRPMLMLTDAASDSAGVLLKRLAVYSGWDCDFLNPADSFDAAEYSCAVICAEDLPEDTAQELLNADIPLYVIGTGGLDKLTKTVSVKGSVAAEWTDAAGNTARVLTALNEIIMPENGRDEGGSLYVGSGLYPLCQSSGKLTCLPVCVPEDEVFRAFLASSLQKWLWPFNDEPRAYSQYLVADNVYPFSDPDRIVELADMMDGLNLQWNICVMPFYSNADFPSVKRFCEALTYAQSKGAGIILHVPLVSLENQDWTDVREMLEIAWKAYADYGVYPVALEMPEKWILTQSGADLSASWRTVLLYATDEELPDIAKNTVYSMGHQLIAPSFGQSKAFTSAYAQAVYFDINDDDETLLAFFGRLKNSKRALSSLRYSENVVYAASSRLSCDALGNLRLDGILLDTSYKPFVYEDNYEYDRGFARYMTEQIETSNRAILVFVGIACTFFISAMWLSRRAIRRQLLRRRYIDDGGDGK